MIPRFTIQTIDQVLEKVIIQSHWLELLSDKNIKALLEDGPEGRELLISMGKKGRNYLMWICAGALLQTGEWRTFHSREMAWALLASFWGMKAPKHVPICTTWPTLWDKEVKITLANFKRHTVYLEHYRGPEDLPQALDYLWPIMNKDKRRLFLKITKTQHESTSMSTMVSMQSSSQPPSKASEKQSQANKPPPASGKSTKGEEGSKEGLTPHSQVQQTASTDTKPMESEDRSDSHSQPQQAPPTDTGQEGETAQGIATADTKTQFSQQVNVGSAEEDEDSRTRNEPTPPNLSSLRWYLLGDLNMDAYIDIFNVLSAEAS